jgi:hypothetical protein
VTKQTRDEEDWKAAEAALDAAREMPSGAARIKAMKKAGKMRFEADRRRREQEGFAVRLSPHSASSAAD